MSHCLDDFEQPNKTALLVPNTNARARCTGDDESAPKTRDSTRYRYPGKELIEEHQAGLREEAEVDGAADAELESDEEGEADEEPESADTAKDMQI